jgi:hypothetical protein
MEIKKHYAVVHYNKFITDVNRADQHLSSEENCKMVKNGGTVSAKLCAQHIFCVRDMFNFLYCYVCSVLSIMYNVCV